jgi:hypothetical protein
MSDFVQIKLHDKGDGVEEVWARAVDAGLYEIASVPFLHMSPTSGDIVAAHDEGGSLTFDKVVKKGGRWVAVYNWFPRKGATTADVVARLDGAAKTADLVVENCLEPAEGVAGCVYVAAPKAMTPEQLDNLLGSSGAAADLERVLPVALSPGKPVKGQTGAPPKNLALKPVGSGDRGAPVRSRATVAKKPAAKKPAAKKAKRPVAKKKPAAKKPAAKKAKRPAAKKKPAKKKRR